VEEVQVLLLDMDGVEVEEVLVALERLLLSIPLQVQVALERVFP